MTRHATFSQAVNWSPLKPTLPAARMEAGRCGEGSCAPTQESIRAMRVDEIVLDHLPMRRDLDSVPECKFSKLVIPS